jgi:hypothetical protein
MKVHVSIKGRGKSLTRKGRMAQGYYCKRKGTLRFYAFDNSSVGPRINERQSVPKRKMKARKY